tara:strand:- start:19631 stop:19960 length:330 start_codon:yes stop_codon:yes gene_type:complete
VLNVVLAYGNATFTFVPAHETEYTTQQIEVGTQIHSNQNDNVPAKEFLLAEEETETNEEYIQTAVLFVALFQSFIWKDFTSILPSGEYAFIGKKIRTQHIYSFIETFRI